MPARFSKDTTMDRYPLMIFRAPGTELCHGISCETRIVQDDNDLDEALDEGWHLTVADADEAVTGAKARLAADAHAAVLAQEADAAEQAAAAIRAPLQAELERVSKLLDATYKDVARAADDIKAEQEAHAATRAELAAARESKASTDSAAPAPAPAAGKAKKA